MRLVGHKRPRVIIGYNPLTRFEGLSVRALHPGLGRVTPWSDLLTMISVHRVGALTPWGCRSCREIKHLLWSLRLSEYSMTKCAPVWRCGLPSAQCQRTEASPMVYYPDLLGLLVFISILFKLSGMGLDMVILIFRY